MVGLPNREPTEQAISLTVPAEDPGHPAHSIRSAEVDLNGTPTTIVAQAFADRIFIIVTQVDKLGTLIEAHAEEGAGAGGSSFETRILLGRRDAPEFELIARAVAARLAADGCLKPLLLSVALREHSMPLMSRIINAVSRLRVW